MIVLLPTALLLGLSCVSTAAAADFLTAPKLLAQDLHVDEVRLGAGISNLELVGLVVGDPGSFSKGRLDALQFDVLFGQLDAGPSSSLGRFRPEAGGVLNTSGHESFVDAGLNWQVPLGSSRFYIESSLGLGAHNGYLNNAPNAGFRNLGCPVLVHYAYGLGANLNDHVTVTARWEHLSGVVFGCEPNQGLNDAGVQLGWKF